MAKTTGNPDCKINIPNQLNLAVMAEKLNSSKHNQVEVQQYFETLHLESSLNVFGFVK